ncbi:MAG: RNA-binding protein [Xanthobacteraceae bacterium]|nr:MAG: RNA-binding protein [Xanthobacteraceae bacterium]
MPAAPDPADLDAADLDAGPGVRTGTQRMCAVTRQVRPVGEMIRFVVGPGGDVVPDLKHKLPGRGLWLTASRAVLDQAVRRKTFGRGFKREVTVAPDFAAATDRLMVRAATDALAIAAKAGEVVAGFAKVEAALAEGGVAALIHAAEAAPDGVRKLDAAARRGAGEARGAPVIVNALTGAELDLALGRTNVIHAALLAGPAGRTFLTRQARLVQFRQADPGERERLGAGTDQVKTGPSEDGTG